MVKKYDKFIVLTEEDKPEWGTLNNIQVISNANSFESEETAQLDNKIVLASGRYGYQKNFEDLVKTWAAVHEKHPDWVLNIRGQGLENLQEMIGSLSLKKYISLEHSNDMKSECLNASIFVLTSRYEGMPMVFLEAQACGIPLVSYACKCGPRDVITDGENGFLVETGNIPELITKINQLIENESLRKQMGQKAKEMSKRFSEEKIMKRWIDLFAELTNRK